MLNVRLVVVPIALWSLACTESVESTDVRTTGIYPEIEVTADGGGNSSVEVRLKVGGNKSNTFLELKGDDTLEVTVEGETKTMEQSGNSYKARFDVDAEGTEFTIAFLRSDADESAPASTVRLPAPFEMMVGTREASRASDDVEYTWEPPGSGDMDWKLDGDCVQLDSGSTPDDGMNTLTADSIETFESDAEETCTVEIELTRSRGGEIDDAFTEGGRIVARQVRSDSFTSTP
jgi:hypothetical protein